MPHEEIVPGLSPTAVQVIEQFLAALRARELLENHALNRLEKILLTGTIPKPDEIGAALFDPPQESEK